MRSPQHADAEMSAMRDSGIRGRFAYGSGARHAQRQADGYRRSRPRQARLDGQGRHADARHLFAQRRRRQCRDARRHQHRHGEEGMGRGARPRPADHAAYLRQRRRSRCWRGRPARRPTCSWCIRSTPTPKTAPCWPSTASAIRPRRSAKRGRPGEMQFAEMLEAGVKMSMSIDHITTYDCDCFVCMRMLYTLNTHRFGAKNKADDQAAGAARHHRRRHATSALPTRPAR